MDFVECAIQRGQGPRAELGVRVYARHPQARRKSRDLRLSARFRDDARSDMASLTTGIELHGCQ